MGPEREPAFLKALEERSRAIQDPAFVEQSWMEWCHQRREWWLSCLLGHSSLQRRLNRSGLLTRYLGGPQRLRGLKSLMSSETLRETALTVLQQELGCR